MTRGKAGDVEWEEILLRINMMLVLHSIKF